MAFDAAAARIVLLDPNLGRARAFRVECGLRLGKPCETLVLSEGITRERESGREMPGRLATRARELCSR